MFATIRKYQGKPGTLTDVAQQVQHEFVPLLSTQPGFVSYTAIDTGNDTVMSVSVFQDKAAAEAANRVAAAWVKEHIGSQIGAPEVSWGDVVATNTQEL